MLYSSLASLAICAFAGGSPGTITYENVTGDTGIEFLHHDAPPVPGLFDGQNTRFGVGAAINDYDRDGDQDVYICDSWGFPNLLYRNNGDGTFTDVATEAGVDHYGYSHMALFLDLDNDGYDDLVVINDSNEFVNQFPPSQIYRNNGDGTFTNVSDDSGFRPLDSTFGGATAGDYDKDGDLDLFIVGWYDWSTYLYRNDGEFHFTDVTDEVGARPEGILSQWTPVFADFDGDGWQDIFCAVDFNEDYLLHNNGDGTFTEISDEAGITHTYNDMGAAVADLDNDLSLDIYTTNVTGGGACDVPGGCNMLYMNLGDGHFIDGTQIYGVGDTAWGWGTWIFDADLDGHRDLLAVNGWMPPEWHTPAYFFHNDGMGGFNESAADCGLAHVGNTRALVPWDMDLDGDTDFLMFDVFGPAAVYKNTTVHESNHWLVVEAEGVVSNRNGVGSRVFVTAGGRTQMHEIMVGGSFYAAPPIDAHFGLGENDVVEEVLVVFPSGRQVLLADVPADQRLHVLEPDDEPCPADIDGNGDVGITDLLMVLGAWGPCAGCPEDLDGSGAVGIGDLLAVLAAWGPC